MSGVYLPHPGYERGLPPTPGSTGTGYTLPGSTGTGYTPPGYVGPPTTRVCRPSHHTLGIPRTYTAGLRTVSAVHVAGRVWEDEALGSRKEGYPG